MRNLVVFGGSAGSLGGEFVSYISTVDAYDRVMVFDAKDGYDCTDDSIAHVVKEEIARSLDDNDVLHVVNFVGMMDNGLIENYDRNSFKRMMFVNLYSLFSIAQVTIPMLKTHRGRFITLGSNAAEMGFTGMSAYCATKHAAHGFIKCMAKELAPFNVPVNIVNPGAFNPNSSSMSKIQVEQFMEQNKMTEDEVIKMLTSRIPMKRLATNADLNRTLYALLLMMPEYFTGQAISLSGGMVM